jgi:hypothetical protein
MLDIPTALVTSHELTCREDSVSPALELRHVCSPAQNGTIRLPLADYLEI